MKMSNNKRIKVITRNESTQKGKTAQTSTNNKIKTNAQ